MVPCFSANSAILCQVCLRYCAVLSEVVCYTDLFTYLLKEVKVLLLNEMHNSAAMKTNELAQKLLYCLC